MYNKKKRHEELVAKARLAGLLPLGLRLTWMKTRQDFEEVAALRHKAYGKHYASYPRESEPGPADVSPATKVFMVRDARTGELLGTMRARLSVHGGKVAALDPELYPQEVFEAGSFLTMDRFAVWSGPSQRLLVRLMLFSAVIRYARRQRVEWLNCYARLELMGMYRRIGFREPSPPVVRNNAYLLHRDHHFMQVRIQDVMRQASLPYMGFLIRRFAAKLPT